MESRCFPSTSRGRSGLRPDRSGVALLYALFTVLVAAGLIAVSTAVAAITHRDTQRKRFETEGQYLAEGAVEYAKKEIQQAIANWGTVPTGGTAPVGDRIVPYSIAPTGFTATTADASGIETVVVGYEVDSTVIVQGFRTSVHRVVNACATPLFQYAVFYDGDLEILPGPDMTIRGRVHTNRDLYLGSNATLTLDTNYVHTAGNVYRNRKDDPSSSPGTVEIRRWVANPFDPSEPVDYARLGSQSQMSAAGVATASGYDSRFTTGFDSNGNGDYTDVGDWLPFAPGALAYWSQPTGYDQTGSTLLTHEHGVTASVPPSAGSTAMYEPASGGDYEWDAAAKRFVRVPTGTGAYREGYYHANADLSILAFEDGSWRAYDRAGTDVSAAVASAVSLGAMYDARQAEGSDAKLTVLQIDMGALATSGKYPANGLLYAANYGEGTGVSAKGVRLANAAKLGARLTVATPDPVYLLGDYNTVEEKPAAVICDALNLLSNAWDDTKSRGGALPAAADTTYNLAALTGGLDTNGSQYNGGLENLPRFHEDWSTAGKVATIKGSFVRAWNSQYATSSWVYGSNRYQAPVRKWSYNTAFNNVANLPPFTPMTVTAEDIVSW